MVIFRCFEDYVAMINPIKPNIGFSRRATRGGIWSICHPRNFQNIA